MMSTRNEYTFILWGEYFDETAASIFVTELRNAGYLVKVIGLSARPMAGLSGLVLAPDFTIEKALLLVAQVHCVVIPAGVRGVQSLGHDPRVRDFLLGMQQNQAHILTSADGATALAKLGWTSTLSQMIEIFPDVEGLVNFVRQWAHSPTV